MMIQQSSTSQLPTALGSQVNNLASNRLIDLTDNKNTPFAVSNILSASPNVPPILNISKKVSNFEQP